MLAPLRLRNFALLWIAGIISLIGAQLLIVALPFYVYTVSNSTLVTGAVFIAGVLPSLVLGSVAGVYVDRWDRKRALVIANLLLAAVLVPLFAVQSGRDSWIIMAVVFIGATVSQFSMPASNALLPAIVSAADLTPANALNAAGRNIALLAGPPLGGVALISLGLAGVALVDLMTFLVAAALTALVRIPPRTAATNQPAGGAATTLWREWSEGMRIVWSERWVLALFVVAGTAMIGGGIIAVLLIVFVRDVLHASALALGWILSAEAVGGFIGSVAFGPLARRFSLSRMVALGSGTVGLLFLAIAHLRILPPILVLAMFVASGGTFWLISEQTLLQRGISDRYLGRVFGAYGTTTALGVLLGMALASVTGSSFGPVSLLTVAGMLYVLAALVAALTLPRALPAAAI